LRESATELIDRLYDYDYQASIHQYLCEVQRLFYGQEYVISASTSEDYETAPLRSGHG